jgi:hypothetical protein
MPILILLACSEESSEESVLKELLIDSNTELLTEGVSYLVMREEILEDRFCLGKNGECSGTERFISRSSDGFTFEYFQSDSDDNHYCDKGYPCSAIGDYGGGKTELNIWNHKGELVPLSSNYDKYLKAYKSLKIHGATTNIGVSAVSIGRVTTPIDYPYLVIYQFSGGGSCCVRYEFYTKEDLFQEPYVLDYTKNDILFFRQSLDYSFKTIHPGSANNKLVINEDITPLLENHFKD